MMARTKHYIERGGVAVGAVMPHSEVCMHMGVAGKVMSFRIVGGEWPAAQLMKDGQDFSGPILLGEAGVYREGELMYYYREAVTNCYHVCVIHFDVGHVHTVVHDIVTFENTDFGAEKCKQRARILRQLLADNEQGLIKERLLIPSCAESIRVEAIKYHQLAE